MEGHAESRIAPDHRLGIERLADAGHETQVGIAILAHALGPQLHHHADRGGRGVPDRDALVLQRAIPALGVEFLLID